jgi:phosphoenolpyruvate carboxylase
VFAQLLAHGMSHDALFEAVCRQRTEVVLTAHPTQVNRRTLQYKHTRIAALLAQCDRCAVRMHARPCMHAQPCMHANSATGALPVRACAPLHAC